MQACACLSRAAAAALANRGRRDHSGLQPQPAARTWSCKPAISCSAAFASARLGHLLLISWSCSCRPEPRPRQLLPAEFRLPGTLWQAMSPACIYGCHGRADQQASAVCTRSLHKEAPTSNLQMLLFGLVAALAWVTDCALAAAYRKDSQGLTCICACFICTLQPCHTSAVSLT